MVEVRLQPIIQLMLAALVLWALCMRYDPENPMGKALQRGVAGLVMLFVWNLVTPWVLGINPLSALLTGCLGAPGIGLMLVLSRLS